MFATADDVVARLGRELTAEEEVLVESVIGGVTGLIADAAGQSTGWAEDLDPVPATLRELCIAKALASVVNPAGLLSTTQALGAESHSEVYSRQGAFTQGGISLTDQERRNALVALGLPLSGSVRTRALPHDIDVTE